MRTIYKLILITLIVALFVGSGSAALSGYSDALKITIGQVSTQLTDYQVNFTVHRSTGTNSGWDIYVGTDCQDDYEDIRFTTGDGEDTLLDYWIDIEDYSSSSARIWVEVPTIYSTRDTVIVMYYGNASATGVSNGTNTFPLFDDFSGSSLDASKWTQSGSTVSVGGGWLNVTATSSAWQGVYSNNGMYSSTVMRAKALLATHTSGNAGIGYTDTLSDPPVNYAIEVYQGYDSGYKLYHYIKGDSTTNQSGAISSDVTNYHIYDEKRVSATSSILYIDDVYTDQRSLGVGGTLPIHVLTYYSGSKVSVDYVYVYKTSTSPPSSITYSDLLTSNGDSTYIVDGYTVVEFLSQYSVWVVPPNVTKVDYLLVGGGGGGGCKWAGGGGGGGVIEGYNFSVSGNVDVIVGYGGVGSTDDEVKGTSGGSSWFGTANASGGGGGASTGSGTGTNGGSGGGGAFGNSGGTGISGQGYAGGAGSSSYDHFGGGGGGGAGEAGTNGDGDRGGKGGDGKLSLISGIPKVYGGGGGGGAEEPVHPGEPGAGGGGQGGWSETYTREGTDGADGWGGGGGGGGADTYQGGDGGSGTVVIRYVGNVSASFTSNVTSGVIPLVVQFNDTSSGFPTSWLWDFGDGNTSVEQNPVHTYTTYGYYDVELKADNAFSTDTITVDDYIVTIDKFSFDYAKYIHVVGTSVDQYYYEIPVYLHDSVGEDSGNDIYLGGNNVTSTWSDIRFSALNSNGDRVGVEYWIEESNATDATFWLCVPYIEASGASNISVYYDNTDITRNQSDGRRTFLFFDDFEDGTLFNWNTTTGYEWEVVTTNVKSGLYSARGRNWLYQDNVGGGLRIDTDRFGDRFGNTTLDFDFRFGSAGTETCAGFYVIPFVDGNYTYPYQMMDNGYVVYNDGPGVNEEHWSGSSQYSTNTWYSASLIQNFANTTKDAFIDTTYLGQRPLTYFNDGNTYSTSSYDLEIYVSTTYLYGNPLYCWMDNVKIHKFYYPEPYADGTMDIPAPVANFSATPLSGNVPLEVTFTEDSTNAVSWNWTFGDGYYSDEQNPTHIYNSVGDFTVILKAIGEEWYDTEEKASYISVGCNVTTPNIDFIANVTSGNPPTAIAFTDMSDYGMSLWNWSFGDGNYSSEQNPTHIYEGIGDYTVTLIANSTNHCDNGTPETKVDYISITNAIIPPVADFTSNVTSGYMPFAVSFEDASTNTPTSWYWDFGLSEAFTQNATATYAIAGYGDSIVRFNVFHNATNGGGTDWENKTNYITCYPLNASFTATGTSGTSPRSVSFTDVTNNGTATSWYWDFGDGNTSSTQSPTHEYIAEGLYSVTLNASNTYTWDIYTYTDLVNVSGIAPTPTPTPTTATPTPTASTDPGYRTRATATIATLNVTRYDDFLGSLDRVEPDFGDAINALFGTYTDTAGTIAIIILLAIPFIMMWLMQGRVVIPATVGIILSYIIGVYMPVEYKPVTTIFIVLYIISIVYAILRDR